MRLDKDTVIMNVTKYKNVTYTTASYFKGEKDVDEYLGDMMVNTLSTYEDPELRNDILSTNSLGVMKIV